MFPFYNILVYAKSIKILLYIGIFALKTRYYSTLSTTFSNMTSYSIEWSHRWNFYPHASYVFRNFNPIYTVILRQILVQSVFGGFHVKKKELELHSHDF